VTGVQTCALPIFFKAEEAATPALPSSGTVLMTVNDRDKAAACKVAAEFQKLGFKILATNGTHRRFAERGIKSEQINKTHQGRPDIVDAIKNGDIHLIINTPAGKDSQHDDSYIRKNAIKHKIPYVTTLAAALAAAKGIGAVQKGRAGVKSLQAYHQDVQKAPPA
jgi:carbamoyl-phosphate synthase large subunit